MSYYHVPELWLQPRGEAEGFKIEENSSSGNIFHFKVNLKELLMRVSSSPHSNFDWYLKIRVPLTNISPSALKKLTDKATFIEEDDQRIAEYFIRLGRFQHSRIEGLEFIHIQDAACICYLTKKGNLSITINEQGHIIPPILQVDRLRTSYHTMKVEGKLFTKGSRILAGSLVLKGRDTKIEIENSVSFLLNEKETSLKYGLNRYYYSSVIDFNTIPGGTSLQEDVYDLFLKIKFHDQSEEKLIRVGRPAFRAKYFFKETYSKIGDRVSIITPYYTFKGFNLSLEVFEFHRETFDYLQKRLRIVWLERLFNKHKNIWIVGERPYKAQDTGFRFFKYMRENHFDKNVYYVIEKDSPERKNVEPLGNVLDFKSKEHIWHVLMATRIIGSHHPDYLYPVRSKRFKKAVKGIKVFLQHGVMGTKNMIANYGKGAPGFKTDAFLVSSDFEKEMIVNDFGYHPKEVSVTGLSRFDSLLAKDVPIKRQILIIPTWRDWITTDEKFLESEYYERYRNLILHPDLHQMAAKNGLEIIFCLHPNMQKFTPYFQNAPVRIISQGEVDVQRLLKESTIMITDYSSVGFDFSFLHKPIIYFQFDRKRFIGKRPSHLDLDNDLPGDIVSDEEGVLDRLQYYIAHDFKMREQNIKRANKFIKYRDLNSSKRIYEVIENLKLEKTFIDKLVEIDLLTKVFNRFRRSKWYFPTMKVLYNLMRLFLPVDKNLILFESGVGKQYADSPRNIYEEIKKRGLQYKKVWILNKNIRFNDPDTLKIKRLSPQYYYYLAKAGYWINNQNFPTYIKKSKGTTYIQTWHGTPLKKMLFDIENVQGRDEGYLERVYNATQNWDYLISPSEYASKAFRSAFRYKGEILEIGYPRNDIFYKSSKDEIINRVKDNLNIPSNKKVILYAPTFRDNETTGANKFVFNLNMDLNLIKEHLGEEYILLMRMHVVISNKFTVPPELKDFVMNVSNYSDIQELFLISDILMTDYSSVMFDYANTGRPILFFTYDLENYKNDVRGFYMDFEKEAPGPFLFTTEDIVDAVENIDDVKLEYKDKYKQFREKFCVLEDGKAAERVVDRFFS
ncbi:CDP-glycerol glycerophosphotransferase family protein [Bacillus salipaludis]|uniref:CDP-glycerol glycerophosphotransferase family protein n=1 Tax=Bacillus salipaludis TaxID=2547811 RepID=UPI002E22746C|nr:CDP-glycerol glycerophosphotransferase family protein [Bacillus salipaludis]